MLLETARRAAEALADAGTSGLDIAEVREHLRAVSGVISILELVRARDAHHLESAAAPELTGATGMIDFLSLECGLMPEAAQDRVVLGSQLAALPKTAEGLADGTLSIDTAALVARNASLVLPEHVAELESGILEAARYMAPGNLRRAADQIRAKVDARSFEDRSARAHRNRCLRIGPDRDGLACISGKLTSMAADKLRTALEPYMKPLDGGDSRSAEQRRHDALETICTDGGRAHIQVVAPIEALTSEGAAPALLEGLVPISRADLGRLVDSGASISAALKDARGNLVYAGRARNLSAAQRRLLRAVNPTCAFEGCTRPAVQSQAHHLREYSLGGESGVAEEVPLCAGHQRRVHEDGWWVYRAADGTYVTLPPSHPDNPINRLSPEAYRRGLARAKKARKGAAGSDPARPGKDPPQAA